MSRRPSISVPKPRIGSEPPPEDDGEEIVEITLSKRNKLDKSRPASPRDAVAPASPNSKRRGRKSLEVDRSSDSRDEDDHVALNNPRDEARLLGEVTEELVSLNPPTDVEDVDSDVIRGNIGSDTDFGSDAEAQNATDLEVLVTDIGDHTDVGEHTDAGEHTDHGEHHDLADHVDAGFHTDGNDTDVERNGGIRTDAGTSGTDTDVPKATSVSSPAPATTASPNTNIAAGLDSVINAGRGARYNVDPNIYAAIRAHRYNKRHEPRLDDYRDKRCGTFRYDAATALYLMRSFSSLIFRVTTAVVLILAVGLTYLFHTYGIYTDLPLNLLSVGIIFPISFGVQFNFGRRERILTDIASLKSSATSLFTMSREWPPLKEYQKYSFKMSLLIKQLLRRISRYLAHHEGRDAHIQMIYHDFDEISHLLEEIRISDDWIRGVISRGYQYVRMMILDFERLRTVADFRTPSMFRSYQWAWLLSFPALFAPFFSNLARLYGLWAGIYASAIASLMLVMLATVANDMEDPFTGTGVDDLNTEMIREASYLMFPRKKSRYQGQQARLKEKLKREKLLKEKLLKEKLLKEKQAKEKAEKAEREKLEKAKSNKALPASVSRPAFNAADMPSLNLGKVKDVDIKEPKPFLSPRFLSPRFFRKKKEEAELQRLAEQMAAEKAAEKAPPSDIESDKNNVTDGENYNGIKKRKPSKAEKKADKKAAKSSKKLEAIIESSKDKTVSSSEKSGKGKKNSKAPVSSNDEKESRSEEKEPHPQSDNDKPVAASGAVNLEKSADYERDDESSSSMAPKKSTRKPRPDDNFKSDSEGDKASLESQESSSSMEPEKFRAKAKRARSASVL